MLYFIKNQLLGKTIPAYSVNTDDKIFRKIRQKILTKNKCIRHLLCAIGELMLVIIEVFRALSMKMRNVVKQNNAKFDVLLSEINYIS